MHAVIRVYDASPDVAAKARPLLSDLERTMRGLPGFVAYYFLETADGVATITVTDDEAGTTASMQRAADWVGTNMPDAGLGTPTVTRGEVLLDASRQNAARS